MIDFSKLDALGAVDSPQSNAAGDGGASSPPIGADQSGGIPDELRPLQRKSDDKAFELERARAICAEYQENIRKAQSIPSEILKAMLRGEDCAVILLQAADCISKMTGDSSFYKQVEERLIEVYGYALGEVKSLELELAKVQDRIGKLTAAASEPGNADKSGIEWALKVHRNEEKRLKAAIEKANKKENRPV